MRLRPSLVLSAVCAMQVFSCGEPAGPATGPAAALERVRGYSQTAVAGAALDTALVVLVLDEAGTPMPGVEVSFRVLAGGGAVTPTETRTDGNGTAATSWVLGRVVGTEQVVVASVARAGSGPLQAVFTALATPTGPVATIVSVEPALLMPGSTVTLSGTGLETVSEVTVAGVLAAIVEQSSTVLRAVLPAAGFGCAPTSDVPVLLGSPGGQVVYRVPLRTAPDRSLGVGEFVVGSDTDPLACFEVSGGSRYAIAVANVSTDTAVKPGLRVRAIAPETVPIPMQVAPWPGARAAVQRSEPAGTPHGRLLAVSAGRARHLQSATAAAEPADRGLTAAVGDTLTVRVPRLDAAPGQTCTVYESVRARVVHAGQHAMVAEDVANPLAGTMDDLFIQVADEFDARQYDVIRSNFAEPLRTGERVLMLFSRLVNSYGVSGFVWAGDFAARDDCAQSNETEVFYGYVPLVDGQGYGVGTRREWLWTIRPTVVHEVKHLASIVQQLNSGDAAEEPWLEEATAMMAEEIWARAVFGYGQRDNIAFAASVGCEIDGAFDREPCVGRPSAMFAHYLLLANWMRDPEAHTVLGPVAADDDSFYGSAWLFLRWLLDTSERPEAELLRELTRADATGVANIEARFGRPFAEMLPTWAAAVLVDEQLPGTRPAEQSIASWDLRSIYSGLNREQPRLFPTAFPLRVHALSFGNDAIDIPMVRGGSAAFLELSGTPAGPQALAFDGPGGGPLPPSLRVVIVRLE